MLLNPAQALLKAGIAIWHVQLQRAQLREFLLCFLASCRCHTYKIDAIKCAPAACNFTHKIKSTKGQTCKSHLFCHRFASKGNVRQGWSLMWNRLRFGLCLGALDYKDSMKKSLMEGRLHSLAARRNNQDHRNQEIQETHVAIARRRCWFTPSRRRRSSSRSCHLLAHQSKWVSN